MVQPRDFELVTPEGRGILATLNADGVVTFAIQAGPGSSIRGTELFNRMMDYFGAEVQKLHCVWRRSRTGQVSTNIDLVNVLTSQGASLNEAIHKAWTVTRAAKRGFTRVSLESVIGEPGCYERIVLNVAPASLE